MVKNSGRDPFSDNVPSVGMDDQFDTPAAGRSKRGLADNLAGRAHHKEIEPGRAHSIGRGTYPQGKRSDM